MDYAKIVVKNNYEKRGDLVLRSYVRALKKIGEPGKFLLNGDEALIYGVIDLDGKFHEIFTNNVIDFSGHSSLTKSEYNDLCSIFIDLTDEEAELLQAIMESVLFEEKRDLGFEVSTMSELSEDRYVEADAFNDFLSGVNPYPRLLPNSDQSVMMAFNSLKYKLAIIKNMKRFNKEPGIDEYNQENYENLAKTKGQYVRR